MVRMVRKDRKAYGLARPGPEGGRIVDASRTPPTPGFKGCPLSKRFRVFLSCGYSCAFVIGGSCGLFFRGRTGCPEQELCRIWKKSRKNEEI